MNGLVKAAAINEGQQGKAERDTGKRIRGNSRAKVPSWGIEGELSFDLK